MNPFFLYLSVFLGVVSAYVLVYYIVGKRFRIILRQEVTKVLQERLHNTVKVPVEAGAAPEVPVDMEEPSLKKGAKGRLSKRQKRFLDYDENGIAGIPRPGRKISAKEILEELESDQ